MDFNDCSFVKLISKQQLHTGDVVTRDSRFFVVGSYKSSNDEFIAYNLRDNSTHPINDSNIFKFYKLCFLKKK